VLPKAKVIEILGERLEGRYMKVRRVWIAKIENISSDIDFAGKKLKAKDEFEKREKIVIRGIGLFNLAPKHDQILGTPSIYHGSIQTMVDGRSLKNF
jgi:hypothetical protein